MTGNNDWTHLFNLYKVFFSGPNAADGVVVLPFDISSPTKELEKVVSNAEGAFGGIDYIVHNAAYARPVSIPPFLILFKNTS